VTLKKPRKTHATEFKNEAVQLAVKIGVAAAARDLGVYESQIYDLRNKFQQKKSLRQREAELGAEVAMLWIENSVMVPLDKQIRVGLDAFSSLLY